MPFMKVNLNGRKYVISGLSDDTTSKHILCSLARADPSFHLETTEFSDTSVENEERTKGTRVRRTRRTRVRQSSISSLEIVEFDKKRLRGKLTQSKLIDLESSEWSDGRGTADLGKRSKKIATIGSKVENTLVETSETSDRSEEHVTGKIEQCSKNLEKNKNGNSSVDLECSECSEGDGAKKETKKLTRKFSFKDILKSVKIGHTKSQECHTTHDEGHAKCKDCHAKSKESDKTCKECRTTHDECHAKCKDCHAKSKQSDKTCKGCHTTHSDGHAKCHTKDCHGQSCEESGTKSTGSNATIKCNSKCECHTTSSHATKTIERRKKRRTKKRPVSQDVTEWKGKKEEKNEKLNDLVKKRWKSADDIREPLQVSSSQDKKTLKVHKKHKTKRRSKHSHYKIDKKSFNDETISISSVDTSSEYGRVKQHIRKDRIQRMISRTIDQRVVDFHLACMKSYASVPPLNHPGNDREIRAKLLQLIESQQKCLTALKKSEKQNKKAISRYTKYMNLDQDKIQFYGINDEKKLKAQRSRRLSETDTGISEMHSDSSTENTQVYQGYQDDVSDDFTHDDVMQHRDDVTLQNDEVSQCRCDSGISQIDDMDLQHDDVIASADDVTHTGNDVNSRHSGDDLSFPYYDDDVISPPADFTNPVDDVTSPKDDVFQYRVPTASNCVITVDAIAIDDVTHDVKTYVYEKDDDTQSEIIVAQPSGDFGSATASSLVPYRSAESITMSTLSDISDSSFHGNGSDVEELTRVLSQEQQRQRDLRRKLERQAEEIRLMDLRIKEHEKMSDILERLKDLNQGVVEDNKEDNDFLSEKKNLEKSKKLSVNLYEYQKSEISKNSSALDLIESQIRRKRWHVDSAVKELERLVSSSSQSRLDRIRSLEHLPASFAGLSIGRDVIDETLV